VNDEQDLSGALAVLSSPDASPFPVVNQPDSASVVRSALTDFDNQLILDLVANLRPATAILSHYGLSEADLVARQRNPDWVSRYREQHALWNSDAKLRDRIRAKAAYLLEDSLVPLFKIISGHSSHTSKLEAIEKLIKISTVAVVPKDDRGDGAPVRQISIHYGGDKPVTIVSETADERTAVRIGHTAKAPIDGG
jgi:hypothetical protein